MNFGDLRRRDLDPLARCAGARPRARRAARRGTCRSPENVTSLPRASVSSIVPSMASTASAACFLARSARLGDVIDELGLRHGRSSLEGLGYCSTLTAVSDERHARLTADSRVRRSSKPRVCSLRSSVGTDLGRSAADALAAIAWLVTVGALPRRRAVLLFVAGYQGYGALAIAVGAAAAINLALSRRRSAGSVWTIDGDDVGERGLGARLDPAARPRCAAARASRSPGSATVMNATTPRGSR